MSQISMFSGAAPGKKKSKKSAAPLRKTAPKNNDYLEKKFAAGKKIWLSPSGLGGMNRCPRCFWLQYNRGIYQPEGIVSRLANRFDSVIKKYFDLYRSKGELPPMIEGKVKGKLQYPFQEVYFYHHSKYYGYMGRLDECLVQNENKFTPVDHKTSSSDPREKDVLEAYQNQLDSYAFLLEANKKKSSGIGHLIYFYPEDHTELHNGFRMLVYVQTLKTNPNSAYKKFLEAVKVLEKPLPKPSEACPFCKWYDQVGKEVE
ncbi:MAG: PD-(D/E)XK nuclease family protein [Patescibacteria group bacterium]